MKKIKILFCLYIVTLPLCLKASVNQVVFTTSEQSLNVSQISDVISIQLQNSEGLSEQTTETLDIVFSSTSETGEFLSPSSENAATLTMASGTANKNFRYRDSSAGTFILTVQATGRNSGNTLSTTQEITFVEPTHALPTVSVSGTIASSTTWSSDNVYVLENTVTVASGTTLTIMPGTIVKGRNGGAGKLEIYGNLNALGIEETPIYFTSLLNDALGGDSDGSGLTTGAVKDWVGIYFKPGSAGELDHVYINYAGYIGVGSNSGIDNDGGILNISNSYIHDNYIRGINSYGGGSISISNSTIENHQYGIMVASGELTIEDSKIKNNSIYGVDAYGADRVELNRNTFSSNQKLGRIYAGSSFYHSDNTSADITNRGFELSGLIEEEIFWNSNDLPLIISDSSIIWVEESGSLTVNPGSVVKFGNSARIIVKGHLMSEGLNTANIYLTSLKDDSISGDTNNDASLTTPNLMDWSGIEFWEGSTGEISNTVMRYTGGFNGTARSAVYNLGGDVLLSNVTFSSNYDNDFYQTTGSSTIQRTLFSTSTNKAITNAGTSTIVAVGNWWGTATGPTHVSNATGTGPVVTDNVLFDPWLRRDPTLPNPVIIVPGIMGTELRENNFANSLIWPNTIQILASITDDFLDALNMSSTGNVADQNVITGNIIRNLSDQDYFNSLLFQLEDSGYLEDESSFDFPYDWRLDIETLSLSLRDKIDEVKTQTGAEKIDIVAHSMGGLLVKKYLKDYNGNSVDKLIDIGTPHMGSPKSFKILSYGDDLGANFLLGLFGINSNRIKSISQNMQSVYQLLPSKKYFESLESNYYVFNGVNGNSRLNFEETKAHLKSEGGNGLLVDRADEFHREIDDLNPADYGVETYNFVGCGTPTLGQFYLLEGGDHPIYNIKMINGDGTVPLKSAEAMPASNIFYVKNAQHALMPSTSGVKDVVVKILKNESYSILDYSNLDLDSDECQIPNGKIVSLHSPIELHVYDSSGDHTGPGVNGDIENNISGVTYDVIDGNKFAYLPDGEEYTIRGSATGSGTFDIRVQEIMDGEVSTTTLFLDIPLTSTTQAQFDIGANVPTEIYLDNNSDDAYESSWSVSTTTVGLLESTGRTNSELAEPEKVTISSSHSLKAQTTITPQERVLGVSSNSALLEVKLVVNKNGAKTEKLEASLSESKPKQESVDKVVVPNSENTAIVYKSLGNKVKMFFVNLWRWFISRL